MLLVGGSIFQSCNDSYLDRTPLTAFNDANFFQDINTHKFYLSQFYPTYITGHYNDYSNQTTPPFGQAGSWLMYGDVFSDNMVVHGDGARTQQLAGQNTVPQTASSSTAWDFSSIRALNYYLVRCHQANVSNPEDLNRWIAEAYFFKAWDYFQKIRTFGDIPWLSKDLDTDSPELYAAKTPRTQVMDSILYCIQFAVNHLPVSVDPGRVNKYAAQFMKMRICLFEGTFRKYHTELGLQSTSNRFLDSAIVASKAIISTNQFSLYNNGNANTYWKMFALTKDEFASCAEIILGRQYNYAALGDTQYGNAAQRYWDQNNTNYGASGATKSLLDEYLCIDGRPIYISGTEGSYVSNPLFKGYGQWTELDNRDPRLTQTICRPGEYVTIASGEVMDINKYGITFPMIDYGSVIGTTTTGYRCIKHWMGNPNYYPYPSDQPAIMFRYGEVLLDYAEAKYERNGTLSQADVDLTINALRQRAGFNFTTYPSSKLMVGQEPADPRLDKIYQDKLGYTPAPLLREIRRERRVELAIEGKRYEDLLRWKALPLLSVPLRGMNFNSVASTIYSGDYATGKVVNGVKWTAKKYTAGSSVFVDQNGFLIPYYKSPYMKTPEYCIPFDNTAANDYRYYWPVPQHELDLNPNLTQSSGWTGK